MERAQRLPKWRSTRRAWLLRLVRGQLRDLRRRRADRQTAAEAPGDRNIAQSSPGPTRRSTRAIPTWPPKKWLRAAFERILAGGKTSNVTRAGIHADGCSRMRIYNCFITHKAPQTGRRVDYGKTGAAGIKHWIEDRFQIDIPKHDPRVIAIKDRIDAEYAADRISAISDQEMEAWIRKEFGDSLPPARI